MDETLKQEQIEFYNKVINYFQRHPEYVLELQRKIDEEEKTLYGESEKKNEKNRGKKKDEKGKRFLGLDEKRINTIADELSGMIFERKSSGKSVLESTVQDAFSNIVKNYLSKYSD